MFGIGDTGNELMKPENGYMMTCNDVMYGKQLVYYPSNKYK